MDERLLDLRDIHLPAQQYSELTQFALWPFALFALLCAWVAYSIWRRKTLWRRQLNAELALIEQQSQRDVPGAWQRLARLLRRLAIHLHDRDLAGVSVERITGERWLRHLDQLLGSDAFSAGPGRALLELPYAPQSGDTPSQSAQGLRELVAVVRRAATALSP